MQCISFNNSNSVLLQQDGSILVVGLKPSSEKDGLCADVALGTTQFVPGTKRCFAAAGPPASKLSCVHLVSCQKWFMFGSAMQNVVIVM
jgi:hypothetical protein